MTRLFVHIGHPKTGSTFLQAFLGRNRRLLGDQGVMVVDGDGEIAPRKHRRCNYWRYASRPDSDPNRLADLVRAHGDGDILVSSESFVSEAYLDPIRRAAEHAETHILYYAKRQDSWLLSSWGQWGMRNGKSLGDVVKASLRKNTLDFAAIAAPWAEISGRDRFHTRFIDKAYLHDGDLLADFSAATGIDLEGLFIPPRANVSLPGPMLDFLVRQPHLFADAHDSQLSDLLRGLGGDAPGKTLTSRMFRRIEAHYEPLNKRFVEDFMPGIPYAPVIRAADARVSDDPPHPADSRDVMIAALLQLANRQQAQIDELTRQMRTLPGPIRRMMRANGRAGAAGRPGWLASLRPAKR